MSISDDFYDGLLANGPSSETLFIVLSKLREEGRHKRVIQECVKAIEAHPNDIPLRRLLSETYFEIGLFAHAEAQVEKLVAHMDELASIYKLQAMIYHKEKRFQETIRSLKIYLAHRPDDQDAIHLLESLCPSEEPAEISGGAEAPSQPVEFLVEMEPEASLETEEETAVIEKEDFPDIATPTLAEVYLNQGQIAEALDMYERIIADHPEDHASKQRVDELKAMLAPPEPPEPGEGDKAREKKQKMIATLNTWLEEIRKTSHWSFVINHSSSARDLCRPEISSVVKKILITAIIYDKCRSFCAATISSIHFSGKVNPVQGFSQIESNLKKK